MNKAPAVFTEFMRNYFNRYTLFPQAEAEATLNQAEASEAVNSYPILEDKGEIPALPAPPPSPRESFSEYMQTRFRWET